MIWDILVIYFVLLLWFLYEIKVAGTYEGNDF